MKTRAFFEPLEPRQFLDGNVTAVTFRGLVRIDGDELSNIITITQDGDLVTVTPDATTSVNGLAPGVADVLDVGTLRGLSIDMGDGDDDVIVTAADDAMLVAQPFVVERSIRVDLGDGNDLFDLLGVLARDVQIEGGNGNNSIFISAFDGAAGSVQTQIDRNLKVSARFGDDSLELNGVEVRGNLLVNLSGGQNTVVIDTFDGVDDFGGFIGRNFQLKTGNADDSVSFLDTGSVNDLAVLGNVIIKLGAGTNSVTAADTAFIDVGGQFTILTTCNGATLADLSSMFVVRNINIRSGSSNDNIAITNTVADGSLNMNTNRGDDVITLEMVDVLRNINVRANGTSADLSLANTSAFTGRFIGNRNGMNTLADLGGNAFTRDPLVRNFTIV